MTNIEIRKKIIKTIRNNNIKKIAIVMHNSPDGDCIGSAAALFAALKNMKKVDIILQDKVSEKYAAIIGKNKVNKYILPYEKNTYDLVFMLDVSDFNRTYYNIKNITKKIIIIDHHIVTKIPNVFLYLNENDASTGITLYKIIKYISPITSEIATDIYLTIKSDTGNFKNSNTNSKVFQYASELLMYGADINIINNIYEDKTENYFRLLGNALNNLKINYVNKIAYIIITYNDIKYYNSNLKEASNIIEVIKNIKGIDICFLFIENNNHVIIRGRSKNTNLIPIIEQFGGGGHENAVGCIINSDNIFMTKDHVINETLKYISK